MDGLFLIGLTGGIGAGKTTVAQMFSELGVPVVDADHVARQVVARGTSGLRRIVEEFGPDILTSEGALDRAKMSQWIFRDSEARKRLESIVHPAVKDASQKQFERLAEQGEDRIVYEASLLLESGRASEMDFVVVVVADVGVRYERLRARGMQDDEIRRRIEAQMSDEERQRMADEIIDNSGSLENSRRQVRALWQALERDRKGP